MRDDVARSAPSDRAAAAREWIGRSPYPFALVTSSVGVASREDLERAAKAP